MLERTFWQYGIWKTFCLLYTSDNGTEVLDERKDDGTLIYAGKSINLSVDSDFKFWISYNIISPWGWTNGVRCRLAKIGTDKKTLETISEVFYETYSTGLIEKEYSAHHDILDVYKRQINYWKCITSTPTPKF